MDSETLGCTKKQSVFYLLLILALILSGCGVSKTEHEALRGDYDSLQVEMTAATSNYQEEMADLNKNNSSLRARNKDLVAERDALAREKEQQERRLEEIIDKLRGEVDSKTAQIDMIEDTIKIELIDKLMFETGKAKVTKQGRKILARIAPILKEAFDKEIRIMGRTDDLPPSAQLARKYPSNWELSTARASAIIHILQWGYGIEPTRMVAEGVAHYRPVEVPGKSKQKFRKTNRVVQILLKPMR